MSKEFTLNCKCGRKHRVHIGADGKLAYDTVEPKKKKDSIEALLDGEDEGAEDGENGT